MVLIVAFRSPDKAHAHEMLTTLYDRRRSPLFLANAAPEAEVQVLFHKRVPCLNACCSSSL